MVRQMSVRSEELASRVEQTFTDLLEAVKRSTPEQWSAPFTDAAWTQAIAAFHAATAIGEIAETIKDLAEGCPFPQITTEELDAKNAQQASQHASCTVAEVSDLIDGAIPGAVAMVRSLSDAQLDRKVQLPGGMPEVSIDMFTQMALIGHATYHLQTITGAR
jgi:hypothetical protein